MEKKRVVVTGIGTISPLGHNVPDTWEKIKNGKSGIARIAGFDIAGYSSQVAGEVKDFDYKKYFSEEDVKTAKRLESFVHFAEAAVQEALANSGLHISADPERGGRIL